MSLPDSRHVLTYRLKIKSPWLKSLFSKECGDSSSWSKPKPFLQMFGKHWLTLRQLAGRGALVCVHRPQRQHDRKGWKGKIHFGAEGPICWGNVNPPPSTKIKEAWVSKRGNKELKEVSEGTVLMCTSGISLCRHGIQSTVAHCQSQNSSLDVPWIYPSMHQHSHSHTHQLMFYVQTDAHPKDLMIDQKGDSCSADELQEGQSQTHTPINTQQSSQTNVNSS